MKIGIIYDDVAKDNLDCRFPYLGNPGVGGTQYCFLMLFYYISKYNPELDINVYRYKNLDYKAELPCKDIINYISCSSLEETIKRAKNDQVDIMLLNFSNIIKLSNLIKLEKVKSVVWVHNWIRGSILKELISNYYVKKVVFLGQEHYDRYIDSKIVEKAVIIPNMFETDLYEYREDNVPLNVTFVGGLIPAKGFHVLAKSWKSVIKEFPSAHLNVIGTGNLYGNNVQLGTYGIADENYEKLFMSYLSDDNGKLLKSVSFLGNVGKEKINVYKNTKVGVVNPTARTEVCPISALEMEAAGIPIVSKNKNGLPDVVMNNKCGILVKSEKKLSRAIVEMLKENEKNKIYGNNAYHFVKENFSPKDIVKLWVNCFCSALEGKNESIKISYRNLNNNFKWLRIINYYIHKIVIFRSLPSLIDVEDIISRKLRG